MLETNYLSECHMPHPENGRFIGSSTGVVVRIETRWAPSTEPGLQ